MTREEAIKDIEKNILPIVGGKSLRMAIDALRQPERKTGRWILKEHLWECDKCGCRTNRAKPLSGNLWNYNFCPNCGADMREPEDIPMEYFESGGK